MALPAKRLRGNQISLKITLFFLFVKLSSTVNMRIAAQVLGLTSRLRALLPAITLHRQMSPPFA